MRIVIRVDGGGWRGMGHVARCEAIGAELLRMGHRVEYATRTKATVDRVVLATPHVWDGPEDDVVGRLQHLARLYDADIIVRICGDSPLWDVGEADYLVEVLREWDPLLGTEYVDYYIEHPSNFCGVDVMTRACLDRMPPGEHVKPHPRTAKRGQVTPGEASAIDDWDEWENLSIDTPEDLERLRGRIECA